MFLTLKQNSISIAMKLTEGTYENLITDGLKQDMLEASGEGLVCKKEDIET